jgi:hypothetical protein
MSTMTGQQMCETIAYYLGEAKGIEAEPAWIWRMDPAGGLAHVGGFFDEALVWIAATFEGRRAWYTVDQAGWKTWHSEPLADCAAP